MERGETIQLIVAMIMIVAMLFGRPVNYPDNVHTLHGFPLQWGTHQLITIAGPVDTWMVNQLNMGLDLVFWVALILITPTLEKMLSKKPR